MDNNAAKLPRKLWEHPDPKSTDMYKFMQEVNQRHNLNLKTYDDFYRYSCANRAQFYGQLFEYLAPIHQGSYERVVDESLPIDAVPVWFEGVRCNWAENLLYSRSRADPRHHRGTRGKEDGKIAVVEVREGNSATRAWSWATLRREAGRLAGAMSARGVRKGDRVVLVGANSLETLLVFTATTWLGGLFSSSSTDMGVAGILQRTTQIAPKYIFFDDAALYNGKTVDLRQKMAAVVAGMADTAGFVGAVAIPRFADMPRDVSGLSKVETWASFVSATPSTGASAPPPFASLSFMDPFLVYYSSGTTGIPKAIVHAVGPVLLNLMKEYRLHQEAGPDSIALQYTTTGWIMYLASVAPLILGGRVVAYDGSPFQPDLTTFVKIMGEQRVTKLGTSPRWMFEMAKNGVRPREVADLETLRIVTCTGMVLSEQLFEWFYDEGFPAQTHLANVSGGTDIAGCFGMENPLTPVYAGGCQGGGLGVPIAIYDATLPDGGPGRPVPDGEPGELVATAAFPNIPVFLWCDKDNSGNKGGGGGGAAKGTRYHASYFARFQHVWAHGDFCVVHPVTRNVTFLGRADGVLNPSGVRFGSAEIYGVVERLFGDRVLDSLCVGQRRPGDADESVFLFLLMRPGSKFNEGLVREVKAAVAKELTKRHVPKYVFETPEIPTTVNLKKVELPVKQIVSGRRIKPSGTLLNPQSLEYYYQFAKVEELVSKAKL